MAGVKVAILGSGNIGADLMIKVRRSELLECTVLIGRNLSSLGLAKAQSLGIPISVEGINYIEKHPDCCDVVFDATSAASHFEHAVILSRLGKMVIDLTPAKVGEFYVPAVDFGTGLQFRNLNMITCGGQASVPIAYALGQTHTKIDYIEVISSIASRSAGPATRRNLDEYIHTTEAAIRRFSGCLTSKAILNLNPAIPCINMQTTVFAKIANPDLEAFRNKLDDVVQRVRAYVPKYEIIVGPKLDNDRVVTMVRVKGRGDYLPPYAGNLDIINCAAIAAAEDFAMHHHQLSQFTSGVRP
ncbi:MAG: acetaldehyde dehydrogenase (acetylating) [Rhodospirillaceae bacterium]